jgi:hypothetical protein
MLHHNHNNAPPLVCNNILKHYLTLKNHLSYKKLSPKQATSISSGKPLNTRKTTQPEHPKNTCQVEQTKHPSNPNFNWKTPRTHPATTPPGQPNQNQKPPPKTNPMVNKKTPVNTQTTRNTDKF